MADKDQSPTATVDGSTAPAEDEDNGKPNDEGEGEGEGTNQTATEPETTSKDDAQEADGDDDSFDEFADWSDEEGKVFDVFARYNFVWSDVLQGHSTPYEDDAIFIYGSENQEQRGKPFRCIANFSWRNAVGQFTCIYHPDTETFKHFKAKRKTLDGGMGKILSAKVCMWLERRSEDMGKWVFEWKVVKDDRGHPFLFLEIGSSYPGVGCYEYAYVLGKRVVKGGDEANRTLTMEERKRLTSRAGV